LADTKFDIAQATNYALRHLGLPMLPAETIYGYIGNGVEKIIERSLTQEHVSLTKEALSLFGDHYDRHLLDHTSLYPRVRETLEHFREKKKAVATNKTLKYTLKMLDGLKIRSHFEMVLGGDSTEHKKPSPEPLEKIIQGLQVEPNRAVMVGDSVPDILAGKRANLITCALSYGLGKRGDLLQAAPDYLLDDMWQLTEILV
jgi:phosphoglycolate phosphatase